MKHRTNYFIKSLCYLTIVLLLTTCNKEEIIIKDNWTIAEIDPVKEVFLEQKVSSLFSSPNGRKATQNGIVWDKAIKIVDPRNGKARYTFRYTSDSLNQFSNFVLTETKTGLTGFIIVYEPANDWYKNGSDFAKFTGRLLSFDLNGVVTGMSLVKDGKTIQGQSNKSGRTNDLPPFPESPGCYELVLSTATGSYFWVQSACGGGGGSSSSSSGSSSGGVTGGGSTSGGSGSGSSGWNDSNYGNNNSGGGLNGGGTNGTGGEGFGDTPIGVYYNRPYVAEIVSAVNFVLDADPTKLINIPCDQLPKWQALTQHKPTQPILDKLNSIKAKYPLNDVAWQSIENASGDVVNLDYFPVTITALPNNPATGQRFSATEFLNYIRTHMNDFVDTSITSFSPSTITGYNETQIWNSNNPLGGVIHLDISGGAGDGTVICTDYNASHWIFSTIEVPYDPFRQGFDGEHPVSGNREFGLTQNPNGSYTFYTRGVDRITDAVDAYVANKILSDPFQNPDALWNSFKNGIYTFTQGHSGTALAPSVSDNSIYRPDWSKVSQVLQGQRPISELGCN
jgi:hypothetical protein